MYLGIEIGGTKLQVGVGAGSSDEMVALERRSIRAADGARAIIGQLETVVPPLIGRHAVQSMGIGFGGPIDHNTGRVTTSHQVTGWDDFPLVEWCETTFGVATTLGNDCDTAALAEAHVGAGRGAQSVFYVTIGTGIGGGLCVDGESFGMSRPAIAEIGHLRPGFPSDAEDVTVEGLASGPAIERSVRTQVASFGSDHPDAQDLMARCHADLDALRCQEIASAAEEGNGLAAGALAAAGKALGWAIAQVTTLIAPQVVVVGGGVSLIADHLFLDHARSAAATFVFPPLAHTLDILPARLGEEVVVHGAIRLAANSTPT